MIFKWQSLLCYIYKHITSLNVNKTKQINKKLALTSKYKYISGMTE